MKKILKSLSVCLIIVAMLGTTAHAAQPDGVQSNSYIFKTTVSPVALANGVIEFDCGVTATGTMDMVGIEEIIFYKADGTYLDSRYYTDPGCEDMMKYNSFKHNAGIQFQGEPGQSYYAMVYFYARKGNGSGGVNMESSVVKATRQSTVGSH
ncbi:MAG: hypothetical protein J1E06_09980 [Acutalibacter sp.]|nr:hypothetical protein [Acutalibacter sp.]